MTDEQYRDLVEFRRQIRQFLHFSESTAKEFGIEPQQHQLLLAVQGLPEGVRPTIGELASRLFIQHHRAVELVNRLEVTGAIARSPGPEDKREVWIRLTKAGRAALDRLALAHREELERSGPELARALQSVLRHRRKARIEKCEDRTGRRVEEKLPRSSRRGYRFLAGAARKGLRRGAGRVGGRE